ncbi:hypothetical protein ACWKWN_19555 [Microbacterium trichothecenolyticum]
MGSSGGARTAGMGAFSRLRAATLIAVAALVAAGLLASPASAATGLPTGSDGRGFEAASPSPTTGNEADAMATVAQYEEAFAEVDCDLFVQVTTPRFRERIGLADCDSFTSNAEGRAEALESVVVEPVSAEGRGRAEIAALVHTTITSRSDENGETTEDPSESEYDFRYHLVHYDDAWKVDTVHILPDGRNEGEVTEDEQDAVTRMLVDWRAAYTAGDCDALLASTTAGYREEMGWTDCPVFQQYIADQNAWCPMDVRQEDIRARTVVDDHVGEIMLDVVEVCTLETDESGEPIVPPYEAGAPYRYHLVSEDGEWRIAEGDNAAAAEDEPSNENERAAVETIRDYNQAWIDADCDAYMATTTESFRIGLNVNGCAGFAPAARSYAEGVANFAHTPTDIERPSMDIMEIKVHETYDSLTDADGRPLEEPYVVDEYWVYTLRLVDGAWIISDVVMLV